LLATSRIQETTVLEDIDGNMHAGMYRAAHIVAAVNVVNVDFVRIAPTRRQRTPDDKPIAAVLESRTAFNDHRTDNDKPVLTAKMPMPMVVRNAPVVPFNDHTPLDYHRPLVLTGFVAFPSFVATMVFMLTRLVALVRFVPLAGLMSLVAIFIFAMMIVIMIVLGKCRHGHTYRKSENGSKAVSNQFHLGTSPLLSDYRSIALCCRSRRESSALSDMSTGAVFLKT
jgi:hypothetical protein